MSIIISSIGLLEWNFKSGQILFVGLYRARLNGNPQVW